MMPKYHRMDFTPLIDSALRFRKLALGVVLLIVLFPRSLPRVLAAVVIVGLLVFLVPESVAYLLAVWHAVFNLFAFLFFNFS